MQGEINKLKLCNEFKNCYICINKTIRGGELRFALLVIRRPRNA